MIKHILLATNGSKTSLRAEDYALHLAHTLKAALTTVCISDDWLMHYGEVDQLMTETTKEQFISYVNNTNDTDSQRILHNFSEKAEKQGVSHSFIVKSGKPEKDIVALAKEKAADLLVIGSGNRSNRCLVPPSTVARKIAKNSPCPVFTAV
jgi:nucleotide-binding universal stress UspA family protein